MWKSYEGHREVSECIFFLITTLLVWRFKKQYLYIYTPSWENVLLYSAINLNNSSHVNFHPYSTMYHHIMDKAHVTEKILEATMWPLANYCFIEIRFAYIINPPILCVHVFSQMCAPIYPSPWLQRKTSHHPKSFSLVSSQPFHSATAYPLVWFPSLSKFINFFIAILHL